MTVTYSAEVANSSFACFLKLLLRWRASMYKLVWKEFLIFLSLFYTLNFVYRFALKPDQKRIFEKVVRYCDEKNNLIPVAFILGFYVSVVLGRWWEQFKLIPWPDRMALFVTANIHGHDERGRLMRRTVMRYMCLSYLITMRSISPPINRRFPSYNHIVEAGFMNPNEEEVLSSIETPHNKYFVPLAWATSLVSRARKENRIRDDFAVKTLIDEINAFRGCLGDLFNMDWMSLPLVYTQVVTLAVYSFFLSCLMGRQMVEENDIYVPIFTFLQFFFYMGWLKVAETSVNPFGEDDDDFDINVCIDRNLQVSYLLVDEMHSDHPDLIKDQYWDKTIFDVPYAELSAQPRDRIHLGSAINVDSSPKSTSWSRSHQELPPVSNKSKETVSQGGNKFVSYVRSFSKSEKPKFHLSHRNSTASRGSFRNNTRTQVSETSTAISGTQLSQGHWTKTVGGDTKENDSQTSREECIFDMSDLESVRENPVAIETTLQTGAECDVIQQNNKAKFTKTEAFSSKSETTKGVTNETKTDEKENEPLLITMSTYKNMKA